MWIWRLADDRFPEARQRLDYYHAVQHLAAVGRALFGEDKDQLKEWLRPLVKQLKNQSSIKVVRQLEEIVAAMPAGPAAQAAQKEVNYLQEHQGRMDYRAGKRRGEPIGSGAVESTCRQAQCRFKRPGQYWSQQEMCIRDRPRAVQNETNCGVELHRRGAGQHLQDGVPVRMPADDDQQAK